MAADFSKAGSKHTMKKSKLLLIWIVMIVSALLVLASGIRPNSPDSIAVDNEQHLYLSDRRNLFVVLQDKILLLMRFQKSIDDISVTEDDFLGVESGKQVYWFDLSRSRLAQKTLCPAATPDSAADTPIGAHSEMVLPDEQNGITYSLSYQDSPFRYRIYRTRGSLSEELFSMPLFDVLLNFLATVLYIALFVCVILFLSRHIPRSNKTNSAE